jgi:hypothetical protein
MTGLHFRDIERNNYNSLAESKDVSSVQSRLLEGNNFREVDVEEA